MTFVTLKMTFKFKIGVASTHTVLIILRLVELAYGCLLLTNNAVKDVKFHFGWPTKKTYTISC